MSEPLDSPTDVPASIADALRLVARRRLRASRALFLAAAGLSLLASVALWFFVDREQGLFVGLWVPSVLALGALLLQGKSPLS